MPTVKSLPDYLTTTLSTFEKNKYDMVGLAQLYPDYEIMKQQIVGRRMVRRMSADYETPLRLDVPSSFEASYANHPLATAAHKMFKRVKTTMSKCRVSTTFSEEEKALKGTDAETIVDEIQARLLNLDKEYWEGEEHAILKEVDNTDDPPTPYGVLTWVTSETAASEFNPNGGDDPFSTGVGGITASAESKWPNATGTFSDVTQDDMFERVAQFLERVKVKSIIPHPSFVSDVPARVWYNQAPIQRAITRYLDAANDNHGMDVGAYRGAPVWGDMPIVIWHALSSPDSPVRPSTGTSLIIDWNTFHYVVHSDYDRKMHGPTLLPNIPGQYVVAMETYRLLHNTRRDRNLRLTTTTTELQPEAT